MEFRLTTPVAIIIFARIDCAKELLSTLHRARPEKLYVISDAPRPDKVGEDKKVADVRKYVETHIDWPCEVKYNYSDKNMGPKYRIYSGISWVFEQEEQAIILEDDCIPSDDFYRYCQEMLNMYKDNESVWVVSGKNVLRKQNSKEPYFFARFAELWGWGTWKRAWEQVDIEMSSWPEAKKTKALRYAYDFWSYRCYIREADHQVRDRRDTWDIPVRYSMLLQHGVGIVTRENMINNIGIGRLDSTNTTEPVDDDFSYGQPLDFPLKKQEHIVIDTKYDKACLSKGAGIKKEWNYIKYCVRRIGQKIIKIVEGVGEKK